MVTVERMHQKYFVGINANIDVTALSSSRLIIACFVDSVLMENVNVD